MPALALEIAQELWEGARKSSLYPFRFLKINASRLCHDQTSKVKLLLFFAVTAVFSF